MNAMVSGDLDITQEYASYVEELWKDAAVQATYCRRDELNLPGCASYFLDKVRCVGVLPSWFFFFMHS